MINNEIKEMLKAQRLKTKSMNFDEAESGEVKTVEVKPLTVDEMKAAIKQLKKRIESLEDLLQEKHDKQFKEAFKAVFHKEIKRLKNKK
jgi:hypothetical protein